MLTLIAILKASCYAAGAICIGAGIYEKLVKGGASNGNNHNKTR